MVKLRYFQNVKLFNKKVNTLFFNEKYRKFKCLRAQLNLTGSQMAQPGRRSLVASFQKNPFCPILSPYPICDYATVILLVDLNHQFDMVIQ